MPYHYHFLLQAPEVVKDMDQINVQIREIEDRKDIVYNNMFERVTIRNGKIFWLL